MSISFERHSFFCPTVFNFVCYFRIVLPGLEGEARSSGKRFPIGCKSVKLHSHHIDMQGALPLNSGFSMLIVGKV